MRANRFKIIITDNVEKYEVIKRKKKKKNSFLILFFLSLFFLFHIP